MGKRRNSFKIVFSDPLGMEILKKWCVQHEGVYDYKSEISKDEICLCDIMTYYLLHFAGYDFYSPFIFIKEEYILKRTKAFLCAGN